MTATQKEFWDEMKDKAVEMIGYGAGYYEVKCYLMDRAIVEDIDVDYNVRELYGMVTKVTVDAYKSVKGV